LKKLVRWEFIPRARDCIASARVVWHREEEIDPSSARDLKGHRRRAISIQGLATRDLVADAETSAKPDRLAVGSILWSKLVFQDRADLARENLSPMGIDNESDQVS